jgi:hypothetical protein
MLKEQAIANHLPLPADEILKDYRLAYQSRQDRDKRPEGSGIHLMIWERAAARLGTQINLYMKWRIFHEISARYYHTV